MNSDCPEELVSYLNRRPPIGCVAIPETRKGRPYQQRERYWKPIAKKSKYQFTDQGYINLREAMITAYNHYGTSRQWLSWTNEYCPINVRTLEFTCVQCDTCGVLYESMLFTGDICYVHNSTEYIGSYDGREKDSPFCLCRLSCFDKSLVTHAELVERLTERTFHLCVYLDVPHDGLLFFSSYTHSNLSPSCLHTLEELKVLKIIYSYST